MKLNRVEKIDNTVKVQTALISVADKTGLEIIVKGLIESNPGITILSTGGTYTKIKDILENFGGRDPIRQTMNKGPAKTLIPVSDYTGQPEMQGGLVKTLDFKIYLGLLSETYNSAHQADLDRTKSRPIDMVVVNLYPFRETIASEGVTAEDARTNIDIGGPCMLRASAKNYLRVAPVCDPGDYGPIVDELKQREGNICLETRLSLAKKAFRHTADYDASIVEYLAEVDFEQLETIYHY
jgi:phosphoribosylaminoimidazolecarboxamide formyltransferase/IMP cyclohydrolase